MYFSYIRVFGQTKDPILLFLLLLIYVRSGFKIVAFHTTQVRLYATETDVALAGILEFK